jgi:hypothetical protein
LRLAAGRLAAFLAGLRFATLRFAGRFAAFLAAGRFAAFRFFAAIVASLPETNYFVSPLNFLLPHYLRNEGLVVQINFFFSVFLFLRTCF